MCNANKLKTIKKCDTKFYSDDSLSKLYFCCVYCVLSPFLCTEIWIKYYSNIPFGSWGREIDCLAICTLTVNCKAALLDKSMYLCHFSTEWIFAPLSRLLLHFFRANVSLFICQSHTLSQHSVAVSVLFFVCHSSFIKYIYERAILNFFCCISFSVAHCIEGRRDRRCERARVKEKK